MSVLHFLQSMRGEQLPVHFYAKAQTLHNLREIDPQVMY